MKGVAKVLVLVFNYVVSLNSFVTTDPSCNFKVFLASFQNLDTMLNVYTLMDQRHFNRF